MSRTLGVCGIMAICLGSIAAGVAILRANDQEKDSQRQKAKAALDETLVQKLEFPGTPLTDVKISGNKTIPAEMILDKLNVSQSLGHPLNPARIRDDVRVLHGTRWFFQVEPQIEKTENGIVLTYRVVERPADQRFRTTDAGALAASESSPEASELKDSNSKSPIADADKVKADNDFADLAEKFNILMDRKQYRDAETVAKRARLLQPKNPVTEVMHYKAQLALRDRFNQQNGAKAGESPPSSNASTGKANGEDEVDDVLKFNVKLDDQQTGRLMFGVGDDSLLRGVKQLQPDERRKIKDLQSDLVRTGREIQKLLARKQSLLTDKKESTTHLDIRAELAAIEREVESRQKRLEKSQTELGDAISHLRNGLKAHVEKSGHNEATAVKMELIDLLAQTHKLAGELKQGATAGYYSRDDLQYFPAGPEFKLRSQIEAIEEYKARQQGSTDVDKASAAEVGKIIENLKTEAAELEKAGKMNEAAQKRQAIRMLEAKLQGKPDAKAGEHPGVETPDVARAKEAAPAAPGDQPTNETNGLRLNGVKAFDVELDESQNPRMKVRFDGDPRQYYMTRFQPAVTSPAMQEAFRKIIENLKMEAAELEKAGKKEAAAQKRQSIQMLEAALRGELKDQQRGVQRPKGNVQYEPMQQRAMQMQARQDMMIRIVQSELDLGKLLARRQELIADNRQADAESLDGAIVVLQADIAGRKAELRRLGHGAVVVVPSGDLAGEGVIQPAREAATPTSNAPLLDDREATKEKVEELEEKLAQKLKFDQVLGNLIAGEKENRADRLNTKAEDRENPEASEVNPEMRKTFDVLKAITSDSAFIPGDAIVRQQVKLRERLQQSQALEEAAAKLKGAGLEDQAQAISKAATDARRESTRLQIQLQLLQRMQQLLANIHEKGSVQGGAPHPASVLPELHRTLTEIREQVQELRKEVGQVRELLEKKP